MITKKMKIRFAAVCRGYGSAMRSATCPFEHGYVEFQTGLELFDNKYGIVRWFNEKAEWNRPFKYGEAYMLEAWVTPNSTLQRVKIID